MVAPNDAGLKELREEVRDARDAIRDLKQELRDLKDALGTSAAKGLAPLAPAAAGGWESVDPQVAKYEVLIDQFIQNRRFREDLKDAVAVLKDRLADFYLDSYTLSVVLQKINWDTDGDTLARQVQNQKNQGIIW